MKTEKLDKANFDTTIAGTDKPVLVDFYADWCGPCRKLAPILDKIVTDNQGKVLLGKYDVDKHKEIAGREGKDARRRIKQLGQEEQWAVDEGVPLNMDQGVNTEDTDERTNGTRAEGQVQEHRPRSDGTAVGDPA